VRAIQDFGFDLMPMHKDYCDNQLCDWGGAAKDSDWSEGDVLFSFTSTPMPAVWRQRANNSTRFACGCPEAQTGTGNAKFREIEEFCDIDMTYHFNATVPWRGLSPESDPNIRSFSDLVHTLFRPPNMTLKAQFRQQCGGSCGVFASVVSNCHTATRRESYVQLFEKSFPVQNYGRCGHNAEFPRESLQGALNYMFRDLTQKVETARRFKFLCALENTFAAEYRTEKPAQALLVGTVPVVFRAQDDWQYYLPAANAAVFVDDFDDPEDAARYIQRLHENDDEYLTMFEWKKRGVPVEYALHIAMNSNTVVCRLCEQVSHAAFPQH
jgi:hypothetical protein